MAYFEEIETVLNKFLIAYLQAKFVNKKSVMVVIAAAAVALVITTSYSQSMNTVNLDTGRNFGGVSTAMGSPILGDPAAPITIIEFGDYQCHQCYNWFHNTKPSISESYIDSGLASLIFVDFAFLGRDSTTAAQASYCAEDQDKYWEYHDMLYTLQEPKIDNGWANSERLKAIAFDMGLDMDLFDDCLDSAKYAKRVQHNNAVGREHGVNGTPTFVIVGPDGQREKIVGAQPHSTFMKVIDSMM